MQTLYGVGNLQGYGGQEPATIWHNFMEQQFLDTTPLAFPTPGLRRLDLEPARAGRAQAAQGHPNPRSTCRACSSTTASTRRQG